MMKEAFAKALIPVTIITFAGICALAPLYLTLGVINRSVNSNNLNVIGGGYFGYKYVTSENFKTKLMNEVLEGVSGMMPKVLDKGLPKMTGESMPIPKNFGI